MIESGGCMSKLSGNGLRRLINSKMNYACLRDSAITNADLLWTVDFGPPVGKDYYIAGKIAALNAMSDIFVSFGEPEEALMILQVSGDQDEELYAGAYDACKEEGVRIIGGHTIQGAEALIGLTVLGRAKSNRVRSCEIGDRLLISKSLGTGIAMRAYYHGLIYEEDYNEAINVMLTSNRMRDLDSIHTATDITGFGFLGHLSEMLGPKYGASINLCKIPILKSILTLSPQFVKTNYITNNYRYAFDQRKTNITLDSLEEIALCDPQTNGPVLVAVGDGVDIPGYIEIGRVTDGTDIIIED